MSVYDVTNEHTLFRQSIQSWVADHLQREVKSMEEHAVVPMKLLDSLTQFGFLTAPLPKEFGGQNASISLLVILLEEIAKAGSTGFAQIIKQHTALALPLLITHLGKPELAQQCIDHDDYCTYVKKRGPESSLLVTNGQSARYIIVHNITTHKLALYDTQEIESIVEPVEPLLGWRTANMAKLNLHATPVTSVQLSQEQSYVVQAQNDLFDAAIFYGLAQTAYEQTVLYIQSDRYLTNIPIIRHKLVDLNIFIEKLHHSLYEAAFTTDAVPFIFQAIALRLLLEKELPLLTDATLQFHGDNGYLMDYDVQRFWRDSQTYIVLMKETSYTPTELGRILFMKRFS